MYFNASKNCDILFPEYTLLFSKLVLSSYMALHSEQEKAESLNRLDSRQEKNTLLMNTHVLYYSLSVLILLPYLKDFFKYSIDSQIQVNNAIYPVFWFLNRHTHGHSHTKKRFIFIFIFFKIHFYKVIHIAQGQKNLT